jgi:hypothetical protein
MSFVIADRVQETTVTTGTGTINLGGAVPGCQTFISGVGTANQCNYCILSGDNLNWETGIGTVTSGTPNTLSRSIILSSSNSNAAVSLTGTSTVFLTEPATALRNRLASPVVAPTAAANWTQRNFGGATSLADVANGVLLADASVASVAQNIRGFTVASPSTPYTIDANLSAFMGAINITGSQLMVGIGWTDGTKVQNTHFTNSPVSSPYTGACEVVHYSNYTTSVAADGSTFFGFYNYADCWFRLSDNGTTVTFFVGIDGVNFTQIYTIAKSSGYLGSGGYSNVGVFLNTGLLGNGGTANVVLRSWYQH